MDKDVQKPIPKPKLPLNQPEGNALALGMIVIVAILVVLLVAASLLGGSPDTTPGDQQQVDDGEFDLVEVNFKDKIDLPDFSLDIPSGWEIDYIVGSDSNTGLYCLQEKNCTIYFLTNQDEGAVLQNIELSIPVAVASQSYFADELDKAQFSLNNRNVSLDAVMYFEVAPDSLEDETEVEGDLDEDPDIPLYPKEIFGCLTDIVCVRVGALSVDEVENSKQLELFQKFLSELGI